MYCTLWEMLNRNECIPVRYEFIPERNEFIPNRNEIIPDRYWNWGSWIVSKNKTFYVGKGSGSIIFNFQAAAAVERKKGELCLLKVLCGMNSFQSGMNSFLCMSHWHMQPWDGKDSLHFFCGSHALALLLDPVLPRAAPPCGRLRAGLGPGLLWVRSGFSPLRGDTAQPPLHHPGRLAHTPAYLHMCTNISQSFVDIFTKYYLWSTHFLCSRGSQHNEHLNYN